MSNSRVRVKRKRKKVRFRFPTLFPRKSKSSRIKTRRRFDFKTFFSPRRNIARSKPNIIPLKQILKSVFNAKRRKKSTPIFASAKNWMSEQRTKILSKKYLDQFKPKESENIFQYFMTGVLLRLNASKYVSQFRIQTKDDKLETFFRRVMIMALIAILSIVTIPYTVTVKANEQALRAYKSAIHTSFGFEFNSQAQDHIIIIPAGLTSHIAYAPLALRLSLKGYRVSVVEVPMNIAIFFPQTPLSVDTSKSNRVFLMGHGVGGVGLSLAMQNKEYDGGVFLSSYPIQSELIKGSPHFLSIYGTNDNLRNKQAYQFAFSTIRFKEVVLAGGNYSQFGYFESLQNDGKAAISPSTQIKLTIEAIDEWISSLPEGQ
jgi:hypothetical protein